jgi:SAM-dependent methyltransferase
MTSPFLEVLGLALAEGDLREVRDLVRRCLRAESRTLELGCGPGLFADLFADGDYVGVDPSSRCVDYARIHRPGAFLCDELTAVGLPGARFDQALGLDLLGPRSEAAGRAIAVETKRLLAPGGRALLIERSAKAERVARLAGNVGRVERRVSLKSGLRQRVAFLLATRDG